MRPWGLAVELRWRGDHGRWRRPAISDESMRSRLPTDRAEATSDGIGDDVQVVGVERIAELVDRIELAVHHRLHHDLDRQLTREIADLLDHFIPSPAEHEVVGLAVRVGSGGNPGIEPGLVVIDLAHEAIGPEADVGVGGLPAGEPAIERQLGWDVHGHAHESSPWPSAAAAAIRT